MSYLLALLFRKIQNIRGKTLRKEYHVFTSSDDSVVDIYEFVMILGIDWLLGLNAKLFPRQSSVA